MAYEVTKLVNGRAYRYGVRSERDPASGKTRNRWTYLGRGDAHAQTATVKPRRNAREALLEALERLLDRSDVGELTAAAVSVEAGLAHGTFYRYFRNRDDAIRALAERLRNSKQPELHSLDHPPADVAAAREACRAWTGALLRTRTQHHGVVRALLALATQDAELRAVFLERREAFARQLREWLTELAVRGLIAIGDCNTAAAVLFAMLDGIGREAIATREPLEETRIRMAVDLVERAVFG
jgi:AcrR family transcriptional regulator